MNSSDIDLSQIEGWLQTDYLKKYISQYRLEQTLVSLLAGKSTNGASFFPSEYDVDFFKQPNKNVCKHYVGKIRHGYELEGVRHLLQNRLK